ncbi:fibronectin type III domain-containing protein [Cellulomonas edaphi]|uniref:Fibronectin type III domain-containing protein n=1 Tax=Cellulomonas edaphi TaxID=3053468 RepID=A0ABT7S7E1_9CELL|nr:fibronectin type III domain-containing protein [Cellulomons edaphi]MDM7831541.1 fibronectin type III domain-containing protein [Cellulomons edaphi]
MSWLRARHRATTAAAVVTVPVLVAVLAIVNQGFPLAKLDLNDGSVWVTATDQLRVGRYNVPVEELNAGLVTAGSTFDVQQDGGDVLLLQPDTFAVVNPADVALGTPVPAPGADVSMAGGVVAVVDADGGLYVREITALESLRVGTDPPDVELGDAGRAVVAPDGTVLAVDSEGDVTRVAPGQAPAAAGSLGEGPIDALTAVGDEPVALRGSTVWTTGGPVDVDGDGLVLQQPGPARSRVLVAGTSALFEVPLDGGSPTEHATTGTGVPAAPVQVGSCAHAAWATATGSYLQLCDGKKAVVKNLQDTSAQDELKFRVNRSMVVLNDTARGRLWLPLEDTNLRTPNWDDIEKPDDPKDQQDDSDSTDTVQDLVTECSSEASPPSAVDDEFGVRPGRSTILSVIDNDSSADCGVLVVSDFDDLPSSFGHVSAVYGGRALQVDVSPSASGTVQFTYTITDGRGTTAPSTATVRLTATPESSNEAPVQLRVGSMRVEQGGKATYQVLADFRDPDGDDLILVGAGVAEKSGEVQVRPDGTLTFDASGGTLGRARVTLSVSDGSHTVQGSLDVDVRAAGSLPPQLDPVHAVTYIDRPITVKPLDAVRSTSDEPVRLASVQDVAGATVTPDLEDGTFAFQASRVGTYYVQFVVTAAPQQATGIARIDVVEWPGEAPPPVAVPDRAFLPAGGEVTIDPLANDSDPSGNVLVLTQLTVPDDSPLRAAVLERHLVQIRASRALDGPEVLTYTVSNGNAQATGQIVVQPVPASAEQSPPVVQDVAVTVRTGGVVTIPVLDTSYDPDGDSLSLVPELPEPLAPGQGLLFVSGDVLRYQAPATPTTVRTTFEVTDGLARTGATLTVTVHASDPATKAPPRPRDVVARVFSGESVQIPIPLVGIDRDGDGVTLLGPASSPKHGRVEVGADFIKYTAFAGDVGTDEFTYAVEDWVGQRAVATIRVGISARPSTAVRVVARDDAVTVRPGQSVDVRVLANDVDSSGNGLRLDPELVVPDGIEATVEDRRIAVVAPKKNGQWSIQYRASNALGGQDTAVLQVTVDDDAPVLRPIARDVVVPAKDTFGLTEVSVDVLAVAQNPSGPLEDLAVSVPATVADVARVDAAGNVIVTLVDTAQTVPFLLTNTTAPGGKVASYAFITVPARGEFPPSLRPNVATPRVASGERVELQLDEYVKVAPGRSATILDVTAVTASKSNGESLVKDRSTLVFTSAEGYAGPASITVPVTDSTGPGDTHARTAYLTIPIDVFAAEDHPPVFTPAVIEVPPGEAPVLVDLAAFTKGPDGAAGSATRYSYAITTATPPGFTTKLEGSVLSVSAAATTKKGTTASLGLRIGYGRTGTLDEKIDLRASASMRPTARVLNRSVPDGAEGQQVTLDVLEGAFNPFPGSPLTVVDAAVETPGSGTAGHTASTVSVRPDVGFIGSMVVRFRVRDVTGDPDRDAEGRITVTVRGKPATPVAPRIGAVRDRSVALSWTAPDSRGTPITGYRVTAQPGGLTKECATTSCTFDGLTNDTEYTFTVEARNAVGWSDPSGASLPARPDAVPDAPGVPTLTFGDGRLDVSWNAPKSSGSPVTSYTVEITGGVTGSVTETSTRHTFTGLNNGTAYTVRVRAHNAAPDPSAWSPSATETPAAAPDAPEVKALPADTNAGRVLEITWTEPRSNGDRIGSYEVTIDGPNGLTATVPAGTRRYTFNDAQTKVAYKVSVRAKNKAGWGTAGTTTASTFGLPAAPTGVTASAPAGEGAIDLSWNAADDNGSPITAYEVKLPDGSIHSVGGARLSVRFDGLDGGVTYQYQVRSVNAAGSSAWSAPASAQATTPPPAPDGLSFETVETGSGGRPTRIKVSWNPVTNLGGGSGLTYAYTVRGNTTLARDDGLTGTSATFDVPATAIPFSGVDLTLSVQASTTIDGRSYAGSTATKTQRFDWGSVPDTVPDVAVAADQSPDPGTFTVSWNAPDDGGLRISGYDVRWRADGDRWSSDTAGANATSMRLSARDVLGADPAAGSHQVTVQVRARNAKGDGAWSAEATTTIEISPPPDGGTGP